MSIFETKRRLREAARLSRVQAAAAAPADASLSAACLFRERVPLPPGAVVSGYWPMPDELDPRPLMKALVGNGHPLCLPVVVGPGRPLSFRAWAPGTALVPGVLGIETPPADAAERVPAVLIVPLLSFDRGGARLGQGAGYYDRTLAALRAGGEVIAVGYAFAAQEVDEVPFGGVDERLDWIVTERAAMPVA